MYNSRNHHLVNRKSLTGLLIIIFVITLSVSCIGCGKNTASTSGTNSAAEIKEHSSIGLTPKDVGAEVGALHAEDGSEKPVIEEEAADTAANDEIDSDVYREYYNSRYGFSVDYPGNYIRRKPPTNGDGQKFVSPNGKVDITVFGGNNISDSTIKDEYNALLNENAGSVGYKALSDDWFVVSWIDNGTIYYQKTFLGSGCENTLLLAYPEDVKDQASPIVENMEASFKPGDLEECH